MRTKSCKNRNYASKGKTANINGHKNDKITDTENENDSEPQRTLRNAAYKMEIYFEHLEATCNLSSVGTSDKMVT